MSNRKANRKNQEEWWLDKLILTLLSPLIKLFPDRDKKVPRPPKTTKVIYGSSEPCYCGSGKKYKKCHGKNVA